jgi:hypothetical protein
VGLDHLSFSVGSRDELEQAVRLFDERGVPHGEIMDIGPSGSGRTSSSSHIRSESAKGESWK